MPATFPHSEPLDPFGAFLSRLAPGGDRQGPLAGVRLCVKDNIAVEGQPFTAGHPLFADRRAERTASAAELLLDAGAGLVGMTRTDSGGFGVTTPEVGNPRLPGRAVGGSSGGTAAAVASGLADLGLGTDTGGSIRIPAACTGLFGFKPTYGRVSLDGVWPLAPSFDHVGLLARELPLLERAAGILLSDTRRPSPGAQLSIAVDNSAPAYEDPTIRVQFDTVVQVLERAGHTLVRYHLPDRYSLARAFGALVIAEAERIYANISAAERSKLGPAAQRALATSAQASEAERHRSEVGAARRTYEACLQACDVLISPGLFIPPPPQGVHSITAAGTKWPLLPVFLSATCFCNLLGAPALVMPVGDDDVAFSLHLASRRNSDLELLRTGELLLGALEGQTV